MILRDAVEEMVFSEVCIASSLVWCNSFWTHGMLAHFPPFAIIA